LAEESLSSAQFREALTLATTSKNREPLETVGKREPDVVHVGRIHFNLARELALPAWRLGAEQVALSRVPPHYFSRRRHLEPLGGSAMRLQLHLLILFHESLFPNSLLQRRAL
jgi:hypothetical protein